MLVLEKVFFIFYNLYRVESTQDNKFYLRL